MTLPSRLAIEDDGRLDVLHRYHILDSEPEPAFDGLVAIASGVCETSIALIGFVARDRQWSKARIGMLLPDTPIEQSICAHVVERRTTLVIPDLRGDPRTQDNPLVTADPFIRFYAGAPLISPEGEVLGCLSVVDTRPRPDGLSAFQTKTLEALAEQVMALLNLRRGIDIRDNVLDRQRGENRAAEGRARVQEALSEQLRTEHLRSQIAQEAGRIGTFDVDIASNTIKMSAESCRIFGLDEQESYAIESLEHLVIPEDADRRSSREDREDGTTLLETAYRVRRANDGALRWVARRGDYEFGADGKPVRFTGIFEDGTERKLAELRQSALLELGDELRDAATVTDVVATASRILGEHLAVARAGYCFVDIASGVLAIESDWTRDGIPSIAGQYPLAMFSATIDRTRPGELLAVADVRLVDWLAPDLDSYAAIGTVAQIKVPLLRNRELVGLVFVHSDVPRRWSRDEIDFAQAVADRTYAGVAKVQAEQQQRLLNQELSHRLKNTLALVQAIATQTLRHSSDRDAVADFRKRLSSLATAHDVLLKQSWTSARIRTLIESVLSLHIDPARVTIEGPDLFLGPKAVLSLSMLLHELSTNAVKHGSLSVERGSVAVSWSVDYGGERPTVALEWNEDGGPPASEPVRQGMGSRLIKLGLAGTGDSELRYSPSGFSAKFRAPLSLVTDN